MARGWESKSVESQQDDASRGIRTKPLLTDEQRTTVERRTGLELSRARLLADLRHATAPQHRTMLEAALAAIDAQLA